MHIKAAFAGLTPLKTGQWLAIVAISRIVFILQSARKCKL